MSRKDRKPKIYDLGKYIDKKNIESLKKACGFGVKFDLYFEILEFVEFLVGEVEKARQNPSQAEVKRDLLELKKIFTQQLKYVVNTKEILETIPNFTRSFLYQSPSSPSDYFHIYDNLEQNICSLKILINACSEGQDKINQFKKMDKKCSTKAAINFPNVILKLLNIFNNGKNEAIEPTCYVDSYSPTGYNGHFYRFVIKINKCLTKIDKRLSLGAPSTIGDAICLFMKDQTIKV